MIDRKTVNSHLTECLKKSYGRPYMLPGTPEEIALEAVIAEWVQREENFSRENCAKFLTELKPYAPSLFQDRPEPEPELHATAKVKDLLKQYADPITGALAFENPWAPGSTNLTARMVLMKDHPELAAHLQQLAKGKTYLDAKQQQREKAQRDEIRAIEYGPEEHKKNPYRNGANLTRLSEFRASVGDQVADFYKREGTTPVQLPWITRNETAMEAMRRTNPKLRGIVDASIERARGWAKEQLAESQAAEAEAADRLATAKVLLGQQKVTP